MRSIPAALNTILTSPEQYVINLILFNLPSVILRYTDLDIDFYFNGAFYSPRRFQIDRIVSTMQSEIDAMQIKLDNADLGLTTYFTSAAIRGRACSITVAGLTWPATLVESTLAFQGIIDSVRFDDATITITVYSPMIMWKRRVPRRLYQPTCSWQFKSSECKYGGVETWCDQSWERCITLENELNYGGFRWIPALVNRAFRWGK